jgi:hypothetical protein
MSTEGMIVAEVLMSSSHGLTLFLVKASHALLDRPRTGFDVEGVLGDFPGDAWHFCRAPRKHDLVALKEVDELSFLFGVPTGPDLYGFGRVSDINLYGIGILVHLENTGHQGHGQAERCCGYSKAELP